MPCSIIGAYKNLLPHCRLTGMGCSFTRFLFHLFSASRSDENQTLAHYKRRAPGRCWLTPSTCPALGVGLRGLSRPRLGPGRGANARGPVFGLCLAELDGQMRAHGGIYARPLAMGNLLHFGAGALALFRYTLRTPVGAGGVGVGGRGRARGRALWRGATHFASLGIAA